MKSNRIAFLFLSVLTIFWGACGNADYSRTKDGLIYKIHSSGKGDPITLKSYLKIHQSGSINDSVIYNTFGLIPSYGFLDSLTNPTHDFLDILTLMKVGDSAIVLRSIDTLEKRGMLTFSETFKKGDYLKVVVKVLERFENEQAMDADRVASIDNFKKQEIQNLEKFIQGKNLKAQKVEPGVFIVTEKEGNGPKVDSGMMVTVNYTGALKDGKVFDSNQDSAFNHVTPFEFQVGMRQVIEGWDIAVMQLKVGTKAKVFIPSMLGYGMQAQGERLPAFSDLVFDIEVLSVRPAEAAPASPLEAVPQQ